MNLGSFLEITVVSEEGKSMVGLISKRNEQSLFSKEVTEYSLVSKKITCQNLITTEKDQMPFICNEQQGGKDRK